MFDLAELPVGDVVDKATDGHGFGNPRMRVKFLQLLANVFFDVLERVEERGRDRCGAHAILNSGAQVLFADVHQAAIGVIDDHEFLGAEQVVRNDEGTHGVFGHDATGVADDVRVSGFQTKCADGKARVHAR